MILPVIFAVCCLVEIISPRPVPREKVELKRLNMTLSDVCGPRKTFNNNCRIPMIEPLNSSENTSEMCSSYKRIFGDVVCALNVSYNNCGNDKKVKELWTSADILSRGNNVTCSDRKGTSKTTMKTFCSALQPYVNRVLSKCLNGTKKENGENHFL